MKTTVTKVAVAEVAGAVTAGVIKGNSFMFHIVGNLFDVVETAVIRGIEAGVNLIDSDIARGFNNGLKEGETVVKGINIFGQEMSGQLMKDLFTLPESKLASNTDEVITSDLERRR